MSVFEIIGGVILILACLAIILLVLLQSSKGNGLSGAIGGGEGSNAMRAEQSKKDRMLASRTKIAAIVLFVTVIAVSAITLYM